MLSSGASALRRFKSCLVDFRADHRHAKLQALFARDARDELDRLLERTFAPARERGARR
jgi:hypothetical protein